METRRWINHSLPQTLGNAVMLLYISAAIDAVLGGYLLYVVGLVLVAGKVGAGYLIANERRIGYQLGIAMAFLPWILRFLANGIDGLFGVNLISFLFEVVLIVLLLHPQSREHQRIWFS